MRGLRFRPVPDLSANDQASAMGLAIAFQSNEARHTDCCREKSHFLLRRGIRVGTPSELSGAEVGAAARGKSQGLQSIYPPVFRC